MRLAVPSLWGRTLVASHAGCLSSPRRPAPPTLAPPCSVATRLLTPTLVATNTFLLAWGRDCAAGAAAVHASALHAAAMRGLTAKDPRLREAAMTYLRCQLQLGGLPPGSQLLGDLQGWVERELAAPGLRW